MSILLKNPMNASTGLNMNGKSPMISNAPPFVLRLSKDERKVFQQNQDATLDPRAFFGKGVFTFDIHAPRVQCYRP